MDLNILDIDANLVRRFWSHVDCSSECWLWKSAKLPKGYGLFTVNNGKRWQNVLAHRISWLIHNSSIPNELLVCHKCDNPSCVNPSHLFLGTCKDNLQDQVSKGRSRYGERHHNVKLTEKDVAEIMSLREKGLTHKEIASKFGVSRNNVTNILNGRRWSKAI